MLLDSVAKTIAADMAWEKLVSNPLTHEKGLQASPLTIDSLDRGTAIRFKLR